MQLLELAFQGVRGFGPSIRVQLKPGYWVLQPSVRGTPPLGSLLSSLLFSDGRGGDASFSAPGAALPNAGLMIQGKDNQTYWLVRNLGRSGALHRYAAATQQFEPVSSDAGEIGQFVRNQLGAPTKAALEGLFVFSLSQLPTHRPRPKAGAAAPAAAKPQLATAMPVEAAADVAGARQKLAELDRERGLAEEVEKLQYKADGLASRVFALESKLKSTESIRASLEEARTAMDAAPTPESLRLPADIVARVERYPQQVTKRDDALAKLQAERGAEEAELAAPPATPGLLQNSRFVASAALGLVALVAGWVFSGGLRYLALLDIPAFGVSALLALRYIDEREGSERGQRRGSRLAEREQKILDQFQAESAAVRAAMKTLNVDTPAGITELLGQRAGLQERHDALTQQLRDAESAPEYLEARKELGFLKAEQAEVEGELSAKGAYVRDGREVEREMARLKESIALAEGGGPAPARPVAAAPAAGDALPDPMPALLSLAADLFATDLPSMASLLKDRAVQYASAFTDRRVVGLEMDTLGKMSAVTAQGRAPVTELVGSDLDLVYLAVRFAVLERYSAKFKAPVILEDVMAGLDPPRLSLMGRVLKGLGKLTQVLHVTERPEFAEAADGQVAI